jgi:hypothetical protein
MASERKTTKQNMIMRELWRPELMKHERGSIERENMLKLK